MEKTGLNYEDYWKEVEELHKETKTPDADLEEDSQKQEVKGRIYKYFKTTCNYLYSHNNKNKHYTIDMYPLNYINYNIMIF